MKIQKNITRKSNFDLKSIGLKKEPFGSFFNQTIKLFNKLNILTYVFFPQHFLNLRPLPQMQGSLRPTFGVSRIFGVLGGQQLVSLQQTPSSLIISSGNSSIFSIILITYRYFYLNLIKCNLYEILLQGNFTKTS